MLSGTLSICTRCRRTLLREWLSKTRFTPERHFQSSSSLQRNSVKSRPPKDASARKFGPSTNFSPRDKPRKSFVPSKGFRNNRPVSKYVGSVANTRLTLGNDLAGWTRKPAVMRRLKAMGVPEEHAKTLLDVFVAEQPNTTSGWFPPEEDEIWQIERVREEMAENLPAALDKAYMRRFMAWALDVLQTRLLVPTSVRRTLSAVQEAADFSHPAEWYPRARVVHRTIHMHVGPTNSGKTHNALRALAAARVGVYASPLRLLAYEVFERLNKGHIVPLGADPNDPPEKHARVCNMVTGEESRILDEGAGLLSCTVEMLSSEIRYDVAVIDEIQMLADPDRGGAWTAAVLGVCASEVHLCGEEAAVPLVQAMLQETGDDLVVHRYERLTPLTVAPESLKGKFMGIQKGDCVVTFSRKNIFSLKKIIEETTGLRCAIVYGRLPPEVRSEQADLFNKPDSGYDVLIGSDAIGMGLNLMIKRIVFETVHKWDGSQEVQLSLSQLKQIAGRAGRYGLHGNDSGVGVVTTLHDQDLPVVRRAIETRVIPVAKRAVLPTRLEQHHALEQAIPPPANFATVFDLQSHIALVAPVYRLRDPTAGMLVAEVIDSVCRDHTLEERLVIFNAPVQWKDELVAEAMMRFLRMYRDDMNVRLRDAFVDFGILEHLDSVKIARAAGAEPLSTQEILGSLEALYRIVVVYMWFSMRFPMVFNEREEAGRMKKDTESAIEWCIEGIRNAKQKRMKKLKPEDGRLEGVVKDD